MATIRINALQPWDLTLTIRDVECHTQEPTVEQVRRLAQAEAALQKGTSSADLLRGNLKTFIVDHHDVLDAAEDRDLELAMLAASAYFEALQKKRRLSAIREAMEAAGIPRPQAEKDAETKLEKLLARNAPQARAPGT